MVIFFVRHAQSIGNYTGDYSTSFQGELSECGKEQALKLAERLDGYNFDHIFVSPLERTMATIRPYLKHKGLVGEIWSELAEGCWQENTDGALPENVRYGKQIIFAQEDKACFKYREKNRIIDFPPEDENYQEGIKRIKWTCNYIKENFSGSECSILVVGHGHAGARLIEFLLGIDPIGRFDHNNTGISKLVEQPDGSFKAEYINRI